ncbi:MAG: hypothetical protein JXQ29_07765 [Planctomycetes bacterium]|nr:hypothetical protein [Planctomycetota bacterium]
MVKGIVLALVLGLVGATIIAVVRFFQRELARLHALILKGEEFHGHRVGK